MPYTNPNIPVAFASEHDIEDTLFWNDDPPPYDTFEYEIESMLSGEFAKVAASSHPSEFPVWVLLSNTLDSVSSTSLHSNEGYI